MHGYD